jgi:hypothetical protein
MEFIRTVYAGIVVHVAGLLPERYRWEGYRTLH